MTGTMITRQRLSDIAHSKAMQTFLFMLGLLLMLLAPLAGVIPGPGGIFVFAAGLALTLKNSEWAKRQYVRFKRWQPKAGRWADWGLRRKSAQRREVLRKARKERKRLAATACVLPPAPSPSTLPPKAGKDGKESRAN